MQIKLLRQIVDNGWTIQNRKNIINTIGTNDFKEICDLANKSRLSGDVFTYNCAEDLITKQNTNKIKETLLSFINNIKNGEESKYASIRYHYEPQGIIAFGYPKEYTNLLCKKFVEAQPERMAKFGNKNRIIKAQPAHYEETYELLSSTTNREHLINQLIADALQTNIAGINVDFEKVSSPTVTLYVTV